MSHAIKAVIFDWAGTVIDFGCVAPIEALVEAFGAEGVPVSTAEARRDMGRAKLDHVWALLQHPPVTERWVAAKGAGPTVADRDRIYTALVPLMEAAATRHAVLIPGAVEVIAGLRRQGVKIGSGTGYTREMMSGILPRAAEQGYSPDVVVCAGETPSGRPAPLVTWKALVELDVWPASACVKVDDAEVGIEEGRVAGCWTVGLSGSGNGVGLGLDAYRALSAEERAARNAVAAASL
ncbi:MAG: phosphonoacetaldehyde hydrolase, partial [Thermoleophilia bacterium]|nr:phosphonoacetaldehyde hydrolase [Thermoleophilia bacterium]